MSEELKTTSVVWSAREHRVTIRPTRAQIDAMMLAVGCDPRKDFDRYLEDMNRCLGALYGLELTLELRVGWVYIESAFADCGSDEVRTFYEEKVYREIVLKQAEETTLRALVRQFVAGSLPDDLRSLRVTCNTAVPLFPALKAPAPAATLPAVA